MSRGEDTNTLETKLDLIFKAIESLSMRTNILEDFAANVDSNQRAAETSQAVPTTSTSKTMSPTQGFNPSSLPVKETKN